MLSSKKIRKNKKEFLYKTILINRKTKGFSLLEIVVSLGLIALFIIPVGNMVLGTVKINKAGEDKQQAGAVLQETVEYIKAQPKLSAGKLSNGVRISIKTDKDGEKCYLVNGGNKNIKLKGTIKKKAETLGSDIGKIDIDGVLFYTKDSSGVNKTSIKNIPLGGNLLINSAVSSSGESSVNSSEATIVLGNELDHSNDSISIIRDSVNTALNSKKNKSILVVIDSDSNEKLNLSVSNYNKSDVLKIYLYNKNKISSRDDINLVNLNGKVEFIVDISEESVVLPKVIYAVTLNTEKKGKVIETMTFDLVN